MSPELLPEGLWRAIEPLLPPEKPKPKGGRPRIDDKKVLTGIIFVLRTGTPWEYLPKECGWGTGMTCLNRLREWHEAGVWEKLHRTLLDKLGAADKLDWSRASIDSATVPAPRGVRIPARTRRIAGSPARSVTLS